MKALLDANVLYPATLRSLLIDLSVLEVYQAHWTDALHDEWIRNLLAHRPDLNPASLQRTRTLMDQAMDNALITDYEPLIETLSLPDPDDRHVLAAAVHGEAEWIVTQNVREFPSEVLAPWGIRAVHPDAFLQEVLLSHPDQVVEALRRGRHRYRSLPRRC